MHDIERVKMLNGRANILCESDGKIFPLSSSVVFPQIGFKISSRHKFHYNCQLILDRDAFKDLYYFRMLCLAEE